MNTLRFFSSYGLGITALIAIVLLGLLIYYYFWRRNKLTPMTYLRFCNMFFAFSAILSAVIVACASLYFILSPKIISPLDPSLGVSKFDNKNPLVLRLDRPIKKSNLTYSISPTIAGHWDLSRTPFGSTLTFTPNESPKPETRYTVFVQNISGLFSAHKENYLFSLQALPLPKVVSVAPADGDQGVLPTQRIDVTFDNEADFVRYDFSLDPKVDLSVANDGPTYHLTPSTNLAKNTLYTLRVIETPIRIDYVTGSSSDIDSPAEISTTTFATVAATGIKSHTPTGGGVSTSEKITIEFSQDMSQASAEEAFSITPAVSGSFGWSGRILSFTPNSSLAKNTTYKVALAKTAETAAGESLDDGVEFSFTTIGYVTVAAFSPVNNASGVSTDAVISITFNQAVDHTSAEQHFTITPSVSGSYSWNGNTLVFRPGVALSYATSYKVAISSPVVSTSGLDSITTFTTTFSTRSQSTTLNVPSYKQAHMYSCMISAARSALAFRGITASESTIISKVGYDTTAWSGTWNEPGSIWGDPDTGIVGDLNGKANNIGWGYGSHWSPIASAVSALGRATEVKTGMSAQSLAQEIVNGNPVIIWWVNGVWPSYVVNWRTSGGKNIRAVNGMHVVVVKGFTGTVENPTAFSVTDSGYGYPGKSYDIGTFAAKWSWFGNTGIVVR